CHPGVTAQMPAGYGDNRVARIDGVERRRRIHAGEEPRGPVPGAGTEFQEPATGLRGREHGQKGADPGLRHHVERQAFRVSDDAGDGAWRARELRVVHVLDSLAAPGRFLYRTWRRRG